MLKIFRWKLGISGFLMIFFFLIFLYFFISLYLFGITDEIGIGEWSMYSSLAFCYFFFMIWVWTNAIIEGGKKLKKSKHKKN